MNAEEAAIRIKVEAARDLLIELYKRLPDMLKEHNRLDAGFRRRCYKRWQPGMDLLKMFVVVSEEYGAALNSRSRPQAVADQDYRFETTVALHARAVRVANEMLELLRAGYPDGALSRWRTLHEIAVIAAFLRQNDKDVSLRFLAHRGIVSYNALRQHEQYVPRSGMAPLEPGELEEAKALRDALLQKFGREFAEEKGWAYPIIPKRKGINLHDLEVATGLDHWRPRFRWASDDIHASAKPYHASLSAAEVPLDKPVLVAGASNSAFTDPAHMCVISLNVVNHALPSEYQNDDDELILLALRILSDIVGETFWEIDQATGKNSARAKSERAQKGESRRKRSGRPHGKS